MIESLGLESISASDQEGEDTDQNRIISVLFNQEEDNGPHPMPTEKIQSLETVNITEIEASQDLQCSVCFESYEIQESVRKLPCNHLFHSRCVVPWLELHGSCPLCRKTLGEEEKYCTAY
ncbi:E3 ubiquitin-protein ligase RNF126-like [Artemia franciscana]|uniref:E3 ubiquitin-protein ligase RNF126-like n=1 Tax=Artemia franciscana TaxID=6661 RepID=UPI0032DA0D0A